MNDANEEDVKIEAEDALDIANARIEGLTAALSALASSLKASGAIDEKKLEEKIECAIRSTSLPEVFVPLFEQPLKQIRYAMSEQSAEDELRIFGDRRIHAPGRQQAD